uniref:Putative myotubularin-related protein 14 n=1 Tax=Ixodes ricinus TaxID=34613 RepID=A0A131XSA1_IXORI
MASPRASSAMEAVTEVDVYDLLELACKSVYRAKDGDSQQYASIQKKCEDLFAKDYLFSVISNEQGTLNGAYPANIVFLEQPLSGHNADPVIRPCASSTPPCDAARLREQILKARNARCRARFPVPVILYEGKRICRSATLSSGPEIYGRYGYDYFFSEQPPEVDVAADCASECGNGHKAEEGNGALKESSINQSSSDWQLFTKVRKEDIRLLQIMSVNLICDFMVEKKKVKMWMNVTSSEKVDKENRYNDFAILALPYPGCEFFRGYRDNEYNGEGLVYDWSQAFVDVALDIPDDTISSQLNIDWKKYTTWDVVRLTQNYMKLLLKYIFDGNTGLLVHCISGWDRTPLFVSLLRLSLWADGRIHPSLTANEMAYLTVAYDWFLFGHHLPDRLEKGEEIFFFCFYMLKHLDSEDFSILTLKGNRERRNTSDSNFEHILLEEERLGSNTSLNSSCSSVSSRDLPPAVFPVPDSGDESLSFGNGNYVYHGASGTPPTLTNSSENGSPLQHGRCFAPPSSPVAVPTSLRQRSESSSSVCAGSWQVINGTGSVRSSVSARDAVSSPTTLELNRNASSSRSSLNGRHLEDKADGPLQRAVLLNRRRQRLQDVRKVIDNTYKTIIAGRFSGGRADGLGGFLQKMGLRSPAKATAV